MNVNDLKIAVIGLGYVGLPLAVEFSKSREVIGFDISADRITELSNGDDRTLETTKEELNSAIRLTYTNDINELRDANCFIITVPTPVTSDNKPDLSYLIQASELVGSVLKIGDLVIFESTVYPGATEEECVPVLERGSKLQFNQDFYCGYSPERINPGDKEHRISMIKKVTSGSTPMVANLVDSLYKEIIAAGTHKAESIKVAEAAKIIENTQRDINIALINELAIICSKLNIDTEAVLEAAGSKWNFLPFRPGLVGGHCIGVDPHYLTYKAEMLGYKPEVILAGRSMNDRMVDFVINQLISAMRSKKIKVQNSDILVLGLTFKENCPDLRNSKTVEIVQKLNELSCNVAVYDPWANPNEASERYGIELIERLEKNSYDAILLTVAHKHFYEMGGQVICALSKDNSVIYDLKYVLDEKDSDLRL